jgi:hypothetical protein
MATHDGFEVTPGDKRHPVSAELEIEPVTT